MNGKGNPPEIGLTSNTLSDDRGRASERARKKASGRANKQAEGQSAQPQYKAFLHNSELTQHRSNILKLGHYITHFPAISGAS